MKFKFNQKSSLNRKDIKQLKELFEDCYAVDSYMPEVYWPLLVKKGQYASNFLIYENKKLIGFLRPFFFSQNKAEIILFIDPDYRKQNLVQYLLNKATLLLKTEKINYLLFSSPTKIQPTIFPKIAIYQYTEYQLKHSLSNILESNNQSIIPAKPIYNQSLMQIDKACFGSSELDEKRIQEMLSDPCYEIILYKESAEIVGKLHIFYDQDHAEIYDLGVLPSHRRKGIAHQLVTQALINIKTKDFSHVKLSVSENNDSALSLYTSCGFELVESHHFWEVPLAKI